LPSHEYQVPLPLHRGLTGDAMPADFGSPAEEIDACRNSAALFDYSFLLRLRVDGPDAVSAVSSLCGRDFSTLVEGSIRYALATDNAGWLVSDLTVWRTGQETLEIMSGRAEDVPAMVAALASWNVDVFDLSDQTAALALQGPATNETLSSLVNDAMISKIPFFGFRDLHLFGAICRVGRLGFTGLDGVEILCAAEDAAKLWRLMSPLARPAGFLAADYLRLQGGLPLFTKEFLPPVNAADIGLKRVRMQGALSADLNPARVHRVCFSAKASTGFTGRHGDYSAVEWSPSRPFPPEPGSLTVTSISPSPVSDTLIGMGYVNPAQIDAPLSVPSGTLKDIRVSRRFSN
jgi:aminomethyltransferase